MQIIKRIMCILIVFALLLTVSCNKKEFSLLYEKEQIAFIEIVEEQFDHSSNEHFQKTLIQIQDSKKFIQELEKIEYRNPSVIGEQKQFLGATFLAVKVFYSNGDYELFSSTTKLTYKKSDNSGYKYAAMGYFDSKQFYVFLNLYLSTVNNPTFPFLHSEDMISSIEIVDSYYLKGTGQVQNVHSEIQDIRKFLSDLNSISYSCATNNFGEYRYVEQGVKAIKIGYVNGDYELFTNDTRDIFISHTNSYCGNCYIGQFDTVGFNALLERYK